MPFLFCNVGWMKRYQGLSSDDQISGGGAYVEKHGSGHEVCNFSPHNGTVFGYVETLGQKIKIDRLGANSEDVAIDGVTVVWTATPPNGGTRIVGWYKNATVFRQCQKFERAPRAQAKNKISCFQIKAPSSDATILPVKDRKFIIPRGEKGGMGNRNFWYAQRPESKRLIQKVSAYIAEWQSLGIGSPKRGRIQSQERKAQVEKAAIRTCCDHFENLGYQVLSVEKDN